MLVPCGLLRQWDDKTLLRLWEKCGFPVASLARERMETCLLPFHTDPDQPQGLACCKAGRNMSPCPWPAEVRVALIFQKPNVRVSPSSQENRSWTVGEWSQVLDRA